MLNAPSVYMIAARKPFPLFIAAIAVAAGLTVALWLLPLGLLAYFGMVAILVRDPALAVVVERPSRPRLTSAAFKTQIDAIERAQREIAQSAAQADGPLRTLLTPIGEQARELLEQAYLLASKGEVIERYLGTVNLQSLRDEVGTLERRIAATTDQYTLDQLRETREARQEKLAHASDLRIFLDRIHAQLQNIAAGLDNVLAESVRLRTSDVVSAGSSTNEVAQRLGDLKANMDAFQQVLDTAITKTA